MLLRDKRQPKLHKIRRELKIRACLDNGKEITTTLFEFSVTVHCEHQTTERK